MSGVDPQVKALRQIDEIAMSAPWSDEMAAVRRISWAALVAADAVSGAPDPRVEAGARALLGPSWAGTPEQHADSPRAWENACLQASWVLAAADAVSGAPDRLITDGYTGCRRHPSSGAKEIAGVWWCAGRNTNRPCENYARDIVVAAGRLSAETLICCDHAMVATAQCEHAGDGLVPLGELIDAYSSPVSGGEDRCRICGFSPCVDDSDCCWQHQREASPRSGVGEDREDRRCPVCGMGAGDKCGESGVPFPCTEWVARNTYVPDPQAKHRGDRLDERKLVGEWAAEFRRLVVERDRLAAELEELRRER